MEHNVEVDFFHTELASKIREENKAFVDSFRHSPRQVGSMVEFAGPSNVESEPVESANFSDFSREALRVYLEARGRKIKIPSEELGDFLCKAGFLKEMSQGKKCATKAGLLLFGAILKTFLAQSKVMLEAHFGTEVTTETAVGPLTGIPLQIERFFRKNLRAFTRIEGFKRIEALEVPLEALREAIMNALAHRDYRGGARVMIRILEDKIVIRSPGLPLAPISLEKIRQHDAPAFSRNPMIASAFADLHLMEERGWGLKEMHDLTVRAGLPAPHFDYEDGAFVVIFYRSKSAPSKFEQEDLAEVLKSILRFAKSKKGRITSATVAKNLKMNVRTVRYQITKARKNGVSGEAG